MTLRWRLTLFYTSLLAMLLLIIAVSVVWVLESNLVRNIGDQLRSDYRQISLRSNRFGLDGPLNFNSNAVFADISLYGSFDQMVGVTPDQVREISTEQLEISILPSEERTYNLQSGQSGGDPPVLQLSRAELASLQRSKDLQIMAIKTLRRPRDAQGIPVLVLSSVVPFTKIDRLNNTAEPSSGILHLARDLTPVYRTVRQLQFIMLLVSLAGILLAGVGAYALSGRALRPLRLVRKAAESISEKTLRQRVPAPNTGDEVEALAHALNSMLDRIERSFEVQRRFTSDASHELRTPVTAIGGHAGYLLRRTQPTVQQAESITIIKNEADRLSGLIASLLELARSDSGVMQLRHQRMLARFFLEDIAREVRPLASAQGAEVIAEGEEVEFLADPDRLRQVVLNLVSNALKAGANCVTLRSEQTGSHLRLQVQDDGPGIPEEHLGRLFDRFYRVEESRSRDQGGSGLGLAIVKAIVDAHGGRIWVESTVGVGTSVYVELPVGRIEEREADPEVA
ncbi:sensor histidine kinase [Deinococcus peraridilitoris]|uniref:histidine kinase n=1 Tax=Deinococcus peraridilitoris (strain DSM 19664 / LMG 22246 / CIP 109416 / KR-200) TaxID=937777 RepID=K9ZZU6_DEIPD|nr:HAMP domain-containing sensor histidine kinase [Deinococcus peraridilitoris]AFZ67143.1 signal transduction histidine kinase [Deinococcus peraridilitoris DSM 19664]